MFNQYSWKHTMHAMKYLFTSFDTYEMRELCENEMEDRRKNGWCFGWGEKEE